ncbi:MAG: ADP-forming succinate--CoA ligase subunit beta [Candidatus Ancillula sp.]|jgi:succinyl-CoA synthetase beta subunit|nr:ADP-forming succinate--CoA ligase subunit beta [Candidatus Ancillula sp.]
MDLYEFQARRLLKAEGINLSDAALVKDLKGLEDISIELPVVVKAQVQVGGRGKAGGVKLVSAANRFKSTVKSILGKNIGGHLVESVLIVPARDIVQELYVSIGFDRSAHEYFIMASVDGGVDIEETAKLSPDAIKRHYFSAVDGLELDDVKTFCGSLLDECEFVQDLDKKQRSLIMKNFSTTVYNIWQTYRKYDATLVEVNPLAIVRAGDAALEIEALDAKVSLDDNSRFRQLELFEQLESETEFSSNHNALEKKAKNLDINYVHLGGEVGIIGNGAGLVMSTVDIVALSGETLEAKPANFLDVGGGANTAKMQQSIEIILADENVKSIFVNIFGGLTQCDLVAHGLLDATSDVEIPVVVRFDGNEKESGLKILQESNRSNIFTADNQEEGALLACKMAKEAV